MLIVTHLQKYHLVRTILHLNTKRTHAAQRQCVPSALLPGI
jgi:hypothetical protein